MLTWNALTLIKFILHKLLCNFWICVRWYTEGGRHHYCKEKEISTAVWQEKGMFLYALDFVTVIWGPAGDLLVLYFVLKETWIFIMAKPSDVCCSNTLAKSSFDRAWNPNDVYIQCKLDIYGNMKGMSPKPFMKHYIIYVYLYNSLFWSSNLIGWEAISTMQYSTSISTGTVQRLYHSACLCAF